MKLSKLLGRIEVLSLPELIGEVVVYREIKDGKVLQEGEKEIKEAYLHLPIYQLSKTQLVIGVLNQEARFVSLDFDDYRAFLLGEYLENYAIFYSKFYWKLKSPSLLFPIERVEREVKKQMFIRKILRHWGHTKNFFKRISPAFIFILKCITFALILKLIL